MGPDCDADRRTKGGGALRDRHRKPTDAVKCSLRIGVVVTVLAGFFLLASPICAGEWNTLEYAIKATFVYKFAPFVTWPQPAHDSVAFPICVSGSDHVTPLIATAVRNQQIDGKPIAVRQAASADDLAGCAILYAASAGARASHHMLAAARTKPILTITDNGNSNEHGIINFRVIGGHVRFDIDQGLAAEAGLTISSKLLNLASAVTPRQNP